MDQGRCAEIFERVRRCTSVTDVEVTVTGGRSSLTRFANNSITQNVSEEGCEISVRVQMGGRTARATTNRLDDESLQRVVRQAEALARVQEEEPELLPMLTAAEQGSAVEVDRWCEETAAMGAGERAEQVEAMVAIAQREGLNSAGTYSSGGHFEALFNSHGVARWHRETLAQASVTMQAEDSSGWQKQNYTSARRLDAPRLAEIAAEKAMRSAHPVTLEPGKYTVILEPSAVVDLIGYLAADFSGLALLEQRSCLNGRLGTKLFGENISFTDDVGHPEQTGAAWDGEGVGRQRLTLVQDGVVREVAMARGTAARIRKSELLLPILAAKYAAEGGAPGLGGVRPTGHGLSLPNESGETAANLVFQVAAGQTKTVEEMRNFRFNQSVLQMLRQVVDLGEPVRACGEEAFDMVAPAMRVEDFQFTEVTRF
jgi:predicted Zn-dependent protease